MAASSVRIGPASAVAPRPSNASMSTQRAVAATAMESSDAHDALVALPAADRVALRASSRRSRSHDSMMRAQAPSARQLRIATVPDAVVHGDGLRPPLLAPSHLLADLDADARPAADSNAMSGEVAPRSPGSAKPAPKSRAPAPLSTSAQHPHRRHADRRCGSTTASWACDSSMACPQATLTFLSTCAPCGCSKCEKPAGRRLRLPPPCPVDVFWSSSDRLRCGTGLSASARHLLA